jgi:hypothetical protein
MAGVATAENWPKMRQRMLQYSQAKGVDLEGEIPENFDQVDINAIRFGEIPVAKQIDQADKRAYQSERLEDADIRLGQQGRNVNSQIQTRAERLDISRDALTERQRSNKVREGQAQSKIDVNQPKKVTTPKGPGEISSKGFLKLDSDQSIWERKGKKWVRVK